MKTFDYSPSSWQSVTTEVKKALDIKELSKSQAERMMKMYVLGKSLEEIITEMKNGEDEWKVL